MVRGMAAPGRVLAKATGAGPPGIQHPTYQSHRHRYSLAGLKCECAILVESRYTLLAVRQLSLLIFNIKIDFIA